MLVYAHKGITLIGYSYFAEKVSLFKSEVKRKEIRLNTGINVICDESEIEDKIAEAVQEEMKQRGWGSNFEGWKDYKDIPEHSLIVQPIKYWIMRRALEELTVEQFYILMKELKEQTMKE